MSALDEDYSAEEDETEEPDTPDDSWLCKDRFVENPSFVASPPVVKRESKPKVRSTANEKQVRWAVKALKDWCKVENMNTSFESLPPQELNKVLASFYRNAKRKDGNEFSKAGFNNIRKGLDSYLKHEPFSVTFSILKDQEFDEANKAYEEKSAHLQLVGSSPWRYPTSLSPQDIRKLLESGTLNAAEPFALLRACWFNITLHFDVGDQLKQRKLLKSQFVFKTNDSGIEYVKMARSPRDLQLLMASSSTEDEGGPAMFSIHGHPLCPVMLLRKYFSKTQPDFDVLFQVPVAYPVDDKVPIWYEKQALGIHQLEGMMSRISHDAQLSRTYLNSSLKATSPLVYVQCGFGQSQPTATPNRSVSSPAGSTQVGMPSPLSIASPGTHPLEARAFSFSPVSTSGLVPVAHRASHQLPSPCYQGSGSGPAGEASVSGVPAPWSPNELLPHDDIESPAESSTDSVHSGEGKFCPKIESVSGSVVVSLPASCTKVSLNDHGGVVSMPHEGTMHSPPVGSNIPASPHLNAAPSFKTVEHRNSTEASFMLDSSDGVHSECSVQSFGRHVKAEKSATSCCGASMQVSGLMPDKRSYLHLQILGGKSFLDKEEPSCRKTEQSQSTVTLHVHLHGQRCKSQPVPSAYDLALKEDFYLDLTEDSLTLPEKVHLVVTRDESGDRLLVGTAYMEWQLALQAPARSSVEISGVGTEAKMAVGMIDVGLEIVAPSIKVPPRAELHSRLTLSRCKVSDRDRRFMQFARQWWKEYTSRCKRPLKIFAQDECGTSRPVFSYVRPVQAGRLLDSPRHAARFVSLLGVEEEASMWGVRTDTWTTGHSLLCRRKGSCEDHAVLLCSLLLGFALDAFVCCGTKTNGSAHAWVMTRRSNGDITFWESLTGERSRFSSELASNCPYRGITCVFNHRSFYANIQSSDSLESCNLHLLDDESWKAMSEEAILAVHGEGLLPPVPRPAPLSPPDIDSRKVTEGLEGEMRRLVTQHRESMGLPASWDDFLGYCLAPLLAYEDSSVQAAADLEELREPLLRSVPPRYSLSSFVVHLNHCDSQKIFQQCLAQRAAVIGCRGDDVTFAIRARVLMFPENACSSRVMLAVRYRSTDGNVSTEWHR